MRAQPVSLQAEAGNVKLARGLWNDEFLRKLENFPAGILAAANEGVRCSQLAQLRAERKSPVETVPEAVPGGALAEEGSGPVARLGSGQTCDLAFNQGAISAADPSRFARAEDVGDAGQLEFINANEAIRCGASEKARQFDIGDEVKAASQVVAILNPGLGAIGQGDAF
jgi:hypothetical protein